MSPDVGVQGVNDGRSGETGHVTLNTIQFSILRIQGSVDGLRSDIQYVRESQMTKSAEYERKFNDQEMRIRVLEAKRVVETSSMWKLATAFFGAGSIVVAIIALVTK